MVGYTLGEAALKRVKDSVLATERTRQNGRPPSRRAQWHGVPERWYTCKNSGATELPAYSVAEVDDETEEGDETIFTVKRLGTTWPQRVAIIGEQAIAVGEWGAMTFDAAYALCDDADVPGPKECWGIKASSTKLWKGYPGFRSTGRVLGAGAEQTALVRPAWPQVLWAKSGASGIPARSGDTPGSATVDVYTLASGSLATTGFSVTAYNASGAAVVASKYLQIVEIEDVWAANYEDCSGA